MASENDKVQKSLTERVLPETHVILPKNNLRQTPEPPKELNREIPLTPLYYTPSRLCLRANPYMKKKKPHHPASLNSMSLASIFQANPLLGGQKRAANKSFQQADSALSEPRHQDLLAARLLKLLGWQAENIIVLKLVLLLEDGEIYVEEKLRCEELLEAIVKTHVKLSKKEMAKNPEHRDASTLTALAENAVKKTLVFHTRDEYRLLSTLCQLIRKQQSRLNMLADKQFISDLVKDHSKVREISNASGRQFVSEILMRKFAELIPRFPVVVSPRINQPSEEQRDQASSEDTTPKISPLSDNLSTNEKELSLLALKARGQRLRYGRNRLRNTMAISEGPSLETPSTAAQVKEYLKLYKASGTSKVTFAKLSSVSGGQASLPREKLLASYGPPQAFPGQELIKEARQKLGLVQKYI